MPEGIGHQKKIIHLDMDCFYAAVEVRDDPSLREYPVIVGVIRESGVVSTCCYQARRFGVLGNGEPGPTGYVLRRFL